jgi:pyruvate/2-oxoacid:ferredoxin oxidoreductase alpha subunit
MVIYEAFYISHSLEPIIVPAQEAVDGYLPPFDPPFMLDDEVARSFGNPVNQDMYYRHRKDMDETLARVPAAAVQADAEYEETFGRGYGIVERYQMDGAETAIVAFGSMCGTARVAVDELRAEGRKIGLVKVKLFRPFPIDAVRAAVAGPSRLVVMERNYMPGVGGCLHQELKAALYGAEDAPLIHGYLAGVGGVNVPVRMIREMVEKACVDDPIAGSVWQR